MNNAGARLVGEQVFVYGSDMADLALIESELERERRSIAMLPPEAPLSRETAMAILERCLTAVREVRRGAAAGDPPAA